MGTNEIIANAATILTLINEKGETDIEWLKSQTNLDSECIYLALGWLLRGSNVLIDNHKTNFVLREDFSYFYRN